MCDDEELWCIVEQGKLSQTYLFKAFYYIIIIPRPFNSVLLFSSHINIFSLLLIKV